MRGILLFFVVVSSVYCKEETLSDLYELLNNPALMSEIEKRLGAGNFDDADDLFSDIVGCYDTSGMVSSTDSECNFYTNSSSIIKTEESIKNGAVFLMEFVNVSCPRDCTSRCCDTDRCDTAVYQDKGERKCYLFHCGDDGTCEFSTHADYWTSTLSTKSHLSHSYVPSGAPHSHENELENLSSHVNDNDNEFPITSPPPPPPTTTTTTTTTTVKTTAERTTTSLPLLGYPCPSYGAQCVDPHAECLMKYCRCRVGYHEKYGKCRKHCRSDQFECERYEYYSSANSRECIPGDFVCDGKKDCIDGSDELNCKDKTKQDEKEPPRKPTQDNNGHKSIPIGAHPDRPHPANRPQSTIRHHASTEAPTTPAPIKTEPAKTYKSTDSNVVTPVYKASPDNDQNVEPVNKEEDKSTENQSADSSDTKTSNNTESVEEKNSSINKFNILNADSVEVASYTDSFQGPIVALALGLAITLMLLIIVGCRLRTVKRRLRKGRALHSNEADYLINGMYL